MKLETILAVTEMESWVRECHDVCSYLDPNCVNSNKEETVKRRIQEVAARIDAVISQLKDEEE